VPPAPGRAHQVAVALPADPTPAAEAFAELAVGFLTA
jgi:hypothetical protein